MNHEQWSLISRLFTDALEVAGDNRSQWLRNACGNDEELYNQVLSLLQAFTSPGLPELPLNEIRSTAMSWIELQEKQGEKLGPYQIQEMIGKGGMGVVYKAYDSRLNRHVAIKFPPSYWSVSNLTKNRFLHEARLAASLDHPNICTIYEADELDEGTLYMVMAYYQGETLQQRLEQSPLDLDEAIDFIIQIARGLEAAHNRGLIHRDIKPANLFITNEGTLKILDFGIAMSADDGITFSEHQPGTAAYMSPEQANGYYVDHKTDLWSTGVIFHEMLTGKIPGKHLIPVFADRSGIHKRIDELIARLLDPNPDKRLKNAGTLAEMLIEYKRQTSTGNYDKSIPKKLIHSHQSGILIGLILLVIFTVIGTYQMINGGSMFIWPATEQFESHTLAVMPFNNISGDAGEEYFSEGFSDDILTILSDFSGIHVISRSALMHVNESERPIEEIIKDLGITHLVEGSLQRTDDHIRIHVQLTETNNGNQLWENQYDHPLGDLFEIQSDIVRSIAEILDDHTLGLPAILEPENFNPVAHDLYLQGRYHWHRRSEEGLRKAAEYFETAVEIAPDYSSAWEGLADAYAVLGFYDYLAPEESFPIAREAARRALELMPNSASAWASLGYVALYYDWNLDWGEAAFRRSISLDPRYSKARQWYANLLTAAARFDEAEREMLRAQELDPLSLIANAALGWIYYQAGNYEDAIRQLDFSLDLNSNFELAYLWKGWALEAMEQYDEALDMLEEALLLSGNNNIVIASLARLHGLRGETDQAESLLSELEMSETYIPAYEIGKAYLGLNMLEKATEWLERAIDERSHSIVFLHVDPQISMFLDTPPISTLATRIRNEYGHSIENILNY
jgi:serine/threonine protein kinase/Tfp pilus assembly protein PilF